MSSLLVPPSTGKKKARARRVFGNAVVDEVDNSLCYSSSEGEEPSDTSSTSFSCSSATSHRGSASNHSQNNSAQPKPDDKVDSVTESKNLSVSFFSPPPKNDTNNTSFSSVASGDTQKTHAPFVNIIGDQKENSTNEQYQISSPDNSRVQVKLSSMRKKGKSPFRRDLVKATQDAINKASISVNRSLLGGAEFDIPRKAPVKGTTSVNQTLRAAQKAKQAALRYKAKQAARDRDSWEEDAQDAKVFNKQVEKGRRDILSLQRQLSSQMSREKAERERGQRLQHLQKVDEEAQFNSLTYREQQQKLRQEEDTRRRMSIAARAQLRENHRLGKHRIKLHQISEEKAIFEERHEASVAIRNHTKDLAQKRRKSYQFRAGDARRIRQLHAQMEAEKLLKESQSLLLKREAEKDVEETKRQMEDERRESLAFRNAFAKKQRDAQEQQRAEEQLQEHKSYEIKWGGERDAEAYKKQVEQERRDSLAFRGYQKVKQRDMESATQSESARAEHESYELKWAGEKDAEAYQQQLQAQKRQSLQERMQMARKRREAIETERTELDAHEHESYELKWAGEKDTEHYRQEMEKARRDSLAFRNYQGKRQRDLKAEQDAADQNAEHDSYELKWAGERDAKAYEALLASEHRASLAGRNKEGRRQREHEASEECSLLVADHASYELKWAGEKDAEEYKRALEKKRRESLAHRNMESVRHAGVMEELRTITREKETESLVLKWAGENDAKAYLAQLQIERRESLQLRGRQKLHERKIEDKQRREEILKALKDEELRAADQKDVETYKKQCAERDRASFEFRCKTGRVQRIQQDERDAAKRAVDANNFKLETEAQTDVEEYVEDCKRRRRLSLAFRAKEKRGHAVWRQQQKDAERRQASRNARCNLRDQRYAALARQKERARIAMDSIRHAGCSFNPFGAALY